MWSFYPQWTINNNTHRHAHKQKVESYHRFSPLDLLGYQKSSSLQVLISIWYNLLSKYYPLFIPLVNKDNWSSGSVVHLKRAILKNPFDFILYITTNSSNNGAHLQFIWREIRVELFSSECFNWRTFECPFKSNSYEAILAFSLCDKITSSKYFI